MKKFIISNLSLLLLTLLIVASPACKKEEAEPAPAPVTNNTGNNNNNNSTPAPQQPVAKTKTDYLVAKPWVMTASTMSPAYMGMTDAFKYMETCEKDNVMKFNTDKTVNFDNGSAKCNSQDAQAWDGGWELQNNESDIIIDGKKNTLLEVNGTTLKVSHKMMMGMEEYTITCVYSAQ